MSNSKSDSSSSEDMSQNFQKPGENDENIENLTENMKKYCEISKDKKETSGTEQPSGSRTNFNIVASTPKNKKDRQKLDESSDVSNIALNVGASTSGHEATTSKENITKETSSLDLSFKEFAEYSRDNDEMTKNTTQVKIMRIVENLANENKKYKFTVTIAPVQKENPDFNFSFPFFVTKLKTNASEMLKELIEKCRSHANKNVREKLDNDSTRNYVTNDDATSTFTVRLLFNESDVEKLNFYKYCITCEITSDCFDELKMSPDELIVRLLSKLTEKKKLSTFDTNENIENFFAKLNGNELNGESEMNIMNIIKLVAKKHNKKYYIGSTTYSDYTNNYDHRFNIFTTYFGEKANIMSSMIIHNCVFHSNEKIRNNAARKFGAGKGTKKTNKFFIFIAYNENEKTTADKTLTFQDGILNTEEEYAEVVTKAIKEKLFGYLDQNRTIKFGFARQSDFNSRMRRYQCKNLTGCTPAARCKIKENFHWNFEWIDPKNFNSLKLLSTGFKDGTTVKLNIHDIRKCELMFISQFMFLEYKNHSDLLINKGRGGDVGLNQNEDNISASAYFRLGKKDKTLNDFCNNGTVEKASDDDDDDDGEGSVASNMTSIREDLLTDWLEKYKNTEAGEEMKKIINEK